MSRLDNAATAEMADAQTKSGAVRQDLEAYQINPAIRSRRTFCVCPSTKTIA
jgi:hypothetical protein